MIREFRLSTSLVVFVLAVIIAPCALAFSEIVPSYGTYIGSNMLRADWLIAFLWSMVLVWVLSWGCSDRKEAFVVQVAWIVRAFICLFASLAYESHYDFLDSYSYFRESSGEWGGWNIGFGSGTDNVMTLCWLHQQVFPGCYHVMKVSFAALGFIGVRFFFLGAKACFPKQVTPSFFLLLALVPSIAFWSSILGKDPIVFLAVGIYAFGVCKLIAGDGYVGWFGIVCGIALGTSIRLWIGPILAAPLVWVSILGIADIRWRICYGFLSVLVLASVVFAFLEVFKLETAQDALTVANEVSKGWAVGGSAQEVQEIDSIGTLSVALPWWMFSFVFRPFPGEIPNIFGLVSGCENIVLLAVFTWACYRIWVFRVWHMIVAWIFLVILVYAAVFAVPGYQNLGSAVRWKLPIIPFLVGTAAIAWAFRSGMPLLVRKEQT